MTTADILKECPKDQGYRLTDEICWFIGRCGGPLGDEKRILAQRMTSIFQGNKDVWVAVPTEVLNDRLSGAGSGR